MTRPAWLRPIAQAAALVVTFGALGSAARADTPCVVVRAAAELGPRWSAAVESIVRQIAQLAPSDCQAMTLSIEPVMEPPDGARVVAVLPDGRRTERSVARPEDLVATAMGLVMAIPPATARPVPDSAPAAAVPSASPAHGAPGSEQRSGDPSTNAPSAGATPVAARPAAGRRLELWFGLEAGGRLAQPTSVAMLDVGLHGGVVLGSWLLSLAVRDAPVGLLGSQGLDRDAFRQVSGGVGVGRRLVAANAIVDVALEPAVTAMDMEYDFSNGSEARAEDVEFSLDAWARLALPVAPGWALTLTLEADVIPSNLGPRAVHLEPPSSSVQPNPVFPGWESALRVGALGSIADLGGLL